MEDIIGPLFPLSFFLAMLIERWLQTGLQPRVRRWHLKGSLFFLMGAVINGVLPGVLTPMLSKAVLLPLSGLPLVAGVALVFLVASLADYWLQPIVTINRGGVAPATVVTPRSARQRAVVPPRSARQRAAARPPGPCGGYEGTTSTRFEDIDGKERSEVRVTWWSDSAAPVPRDRRTVFGHYWNVPPSATSKHAVPPHPSGHPKLLDWQQAQAAQVPQRGQVSLSPDINTICVDYNGVFNADAGSCVGAYRWPEHQVAWARSAT